MGITASVAVLAVTLFLAPFVAGGFGVIGALTLQILIGLGSVIYALNTKRRMCFPMAAWGLTALLLLAFASMPTSESLYQSLRYVCLFTSYLLAFLLASNIRKSEWGSITPAVVVAAAGFLLSVLGVREFTTGPGAGWRVFATFANPNYFSGFLVMALPLSLALYLSVRDRPYAMVLGLSVVLQMAALALTAARFGIAAGVLGVAVFLGIALICRKLDKTSLIRLLIVFVLTVPLMIIAARPVAQRVGSGAAAQVHSGNFRVYTWIATVRMALAHPIVGTGAGTFEIAFPRYNIAGYTRSAHQTFLQAASETGLLAPAALVFSLAVVAFTLGKGIRRVKTCDGSGNDVCFSEEKFDARARILLIAGVFGGLLAAVARNMIDSDWYVPALGITFWFLAGWGYSLAKREQQVSISDNAKRPVILGATSIALAVLSTLMLFGGFYARSAEKAIARRDLQGGISAYKKAIMFMPIAAEYRFGLGRLLSADEEDPSIVLDALRTAEKLEPTRAKYPYFIGFYHANQGNLQAAVKDLQKAVNLDRHSPRLRLALANAYEATGQHSKALDVYSSIVRDEDSVYERVKGVPEMVEPSYAEARYVLAMEAVDKGRYDEAIKHLEAAIERLERRRSYEGVVQATQIAGIAAPEDEIYLHDRLITFHLKLAELYSQIGEKDKAEKQRKRITQLEKEGPIGQDNKEE